MPVPVVAIDVEFPAPPPFEQQLLEACGAGVGPGGCVLSTEDTARSSPYLAYVSWLDQDQQHALVELGNRGEVRGSFEFRRLKFTKQDLPAERSEAIGLTVASLAGSTTPPEPAASAPEIPVQVSEPSNPLRWRLEVTARIASGFRGAGAAPGGALRLAYNLPGLVLFPVGFAGWRTASEAGITGNWWEAGVGLGVQQPVGPVRVSVAGLVVGQALHVAGSSGNQEDSGSSSTSGLAGYFELAWPASGAVGATAGLQLLQVSRATEVSAHGDKVLGTPRTNYGASLGLEGRF